MVAVNGQPSVSAHVSRHTNTHANEKKKKLNAPTYARLHKPQICLSNPELAATITPCFYLSSSLEKMTANVGIIRLYHYVTTAAVLTAPPRPPPQSLSLQDDQ